MLGGLWNLREMVLSLPSQWCDQGPVFELSEPQFLMVQTETITPTFHGVRGTEREGGCLGCQCRNPSDCEVLFPWPPPGSLRLCLFPDFLSPWRLVISSKSQSRDGTRMHLRKAVSA